jgi:predicted HNH restriction endonuclease
MRLIVAITIYTLIVSGCSKSESPSDSYDRYVQLEVSGSMTIEQFLSSYTQRKQSEIEAEISRLMSKNGWSREKIFKIVARSFQAIAKCKNIELINEDVNEKSAVLSYKSTDDCQEGKINIKKEVIFMKYESGWKIDDNDIQKL